LERILALVIPHATDFTIGFEINRVSDRRHCGYYGGSHCWKVWKNIWSRLYKSLSWALTHGVDRSKYTKHLSGATGHGPNQVRTVREISISGAWFFISSLGYRCQRGKQFHIVGFDSLLRTWIKLTSLGRLQDPLSSAPTRNRDPEERAFRGRCHSDLRCALAVNIPVWPRLTEVPH